MTVYIFSVSLPQGGDGLSPISLWAADGKDEITATTALQQRLPHGFKIIESAGIANARLFDALTLAPSEACELSSGVGRSRG